jgi:DNA repair exonuclease SbcCD ATPase subunit
MFNCDLQIFPYEQARLREELKEEEPSKNTNPRNDILAKVLGKNKGSCTLTYGLLPDKPYSWSSGGPSNEEKERIVAEARRLADEEAKPLREKIDAMEKRHKEMEEEMERMRNTIAHMQNMFSAQQHQPNQSGPPLSFWGDR